jgi:hypothetical protein
MYLDWRALLGSAFIIVSKGTPTTGPLQAALGLASPAAERSQAAYGWHL